MRNLITKSLFTGLTLIFSVSLAIADTKVKSKTVSSGQSTGSSTYIKGSRQRSEYGVGIATINQCDLKRTIQINDTAKTYLITNNNQPAGSPVSPASTTPQAPDASAPSTPKGGVITYTTTFTDTGERQQFFGFTARRIKTSVVADSSPEACSPVKLKMETDAWYIDLEVSFNCPADPTAIVPTQHQSQSGCSDEVRHKTIGDSKLGYPVKQTMTMYGEDGRTQVTTIEVIEISKDTLEASLFDIPAGYKEAKNYNEFIGFNPSSVPTSPDGTPNAGNILDQFLGAVEQTAPTAVEPKQPGVIRVGVVLLNNKTNRQFSSRQFRSQLVSAINGGNIEAIPLDARTSDDVQPEAKQKECDYILYTDVATLKKSTGGGMFGKVSKAMSGTSALKDKYEAKVDFKLFEVASSSSVLSASETAKSGGGLSIKGALSTGMMFTGMMGLNPMMMGGMGGGFGGGLGGMFMQQGIGIGVNAMMSSMGPGQGQYNFGMPGQGLEKEEQKILSAALGQEAKAVVAGIQKR